MASGIVWGIGKVALAAAGAFALATGASRMSDQSLHAQAPMTAANTPAPPVTALSAASPAPAPSPQAAPVLASAADGSLVIKRVLKIPGPFRHGDYVWDDAGVPPGPLVITIDVAAQTLSVFRGGYEIGAAVILFGADNKPTPLGVFPITQKSAKHVSNLYGLPMPYMMRLTNDGVAIHGATVERDSATNGCIGVPTPFAKLLFAQVKLGDRVIVTKGERLDVGKAITAI